MIFGGDGALWTCMLDFLSSTADLISYTNDCAHLHLEGVFVWEEEDSITGWHMLWAYKVWCPGMGLV